MVIGEIAPTLAIKWVGKKSQPRWLREEAIRHGYLKKHELQHLIRPSDDQDLYHTWYRSSRSSLSISPDNKFGLTSTITTVHCRRLQRRSKRHSWMIPFWGLIHRDYANSKKNTRCHTQFESLSTVNFVGSSVNMMYCLHHQCMSHRGIYQVREK